MDMKAEVDWQFFAGILNRECKNYGRRISPEELKSAPKGEIGIDGWICEYSVFHRNDEVILGFAHAHRMSNDSYREFNAAGENIYNRSSWGGMEPSGGYPEDYLRDWEESCRRTDEAGIDRTSL